MADDNSSPIPNLVVIFLLPGTVVLLILIALVVCLVRSGLVDNWAVIQLKCILCRHACVKSKMPVNIPTQLPPV